MSKKELSSTPKTIFHGKSKTKLKLENYLTSEDDRLWKKLKIRKTNQTQRSKSDKMQITGYSIAEEINIKIKVSLLDSTYLYKKEDECLYFYDLLSSQYLFLFDFGVVVFWNFSDLDEKLIIKKLDKYLINRFESSEVLKDFMLFKPEISEVSKIEENTIFMSSDEPDEKFAHAYAFAQSLKLEVFEKKVSKTIEDTEDIPKSLATSGEINLSQRKVYKMIGNIFMLRSSVNLLSGMLDVPDCFWDTPIWESVYTKGRNYYDIEDRIDIINNRLDLIKELYDMLNDDLHNKHTSNLEWIVIGLIVVEVLVEVIWNIIIKDILKVV